MSETAIQIEHVSKEYRLGAIGGGTLRGDLQSWWARVRGREDPNSKIGSDTGAHIGERFLALDDVSFEVKKGEALGIIGHNGAGKSTLLKLLSRVTAPTSGTISYNGRIASMLEVGTGFHPELTGRENVYMNGAILGMTKAEIDRKFDQIVSFAEMEKFIDTPVKRYSSGMYVKLAFAVAAHLDSEIMVMDEVLAVGDMKFQQKCLGKMGDAANSEGRTVLYVSHNMNTIRQLCHRCIVLDHGKIIYDGDVENAIELYLGSIGEMQQHYTYGEDEHSNAKTTGRFLINELDLLDPKAAGYNCGEKISIRLQCYSSEKWDEVRFRFEIQYQDGTMAGTMLSNMGVAFSARESKTVSLTFDTAHLMAGRYRVDVGAYVFDRFGNEDFLDGVYPGFVFEMTDLLSESCHLNWLHQYWGHVKLHDLQIDEGKEPADAGDQRDCSSL